MATCAQPASPSHIRTQLIRTIHLCKSFCLWAGLLKMRECRYKLHWKHENWVPGIFFPLKFIFKMQQISYSQQENQFVAVVRLHKIKMKEHWTLNGLINFDSNIEALIGMWWVQISCWWRLHKCGFHNILKVHLSYVLNVRALSCYHRRCRLINFRLFFWMISSFSLSLDFVCECDTLVMPSCLSWVGNAQIYFARARARSHTWKTIHYVITHNEWL